MPTHSGYNHFVSRCHLSVPAQSVAVVHLAPHTHKISTILSGRGVTIAPRTNWNKNSPVLDSDFKLGFGFWIFLSWVGTLLHCKRASYDHTILTLGGVQYLRWKRGPTNRKIISGPLALKSRSSTTQEVVWVSHKTRVLHHHPY